MKNEKSYDAWAALQDAMNNADEVTEEVHQAAMKLADLLPQSSVTYNLARCLRREADYDEMNELLCVAHFIISPYSW